jgi:hypothetical protein
VAALEEAEPRRLKEQPAAGAPPAKANVQHHSGGPPLLFPHLFSLPLLPTAIEQE